jgi:hypothetical protein
VSLKYFFRPYLAPTVTKILLVESGSRPILEGLIPSLKRVYGADLKIDLCTCFPGAPAGLAPDARIYRTADYPNAATRKALFRELRGNGYQALGTICSGEPIMTKWKWTLIFRVDTHAFLINENGDFVWFDREHSAVLANYAQTRLGLEGSGAVRILARIALLPFSLMYLYLFALKVHARRAWRQYTT